MEIIYSLMTEAEIILSLFSVIFVSQYSVVIGITSIMSITRTYCPMQPPHVLS